MTTVIKSINVTGKSCTELDSEQRQHLAEVLISDRARGPILRNTAVGDIDRRDNPTVTLEIEY